MANILPGSPDKAHRVDGPFMRDKLTGLWKCHLCCYETQYRGSLRSHYTVHSSARPFACDQCSYEAKRSYDLKKHKIFKHGKKHLVTRQVLRSGRFRLGCKRPFSSSRVTLNIPATSLSNQHSRNKISEATRCNHIEGGDKPCMEALDMRMYVNSTNRPRPVVKCEPVDGEYVDQQDAHGGKEETITRLDALTRSAGNPKEDLNRGMVHSYKSENNTSKRDDNSPLKVPKYGIFSESYGDSETNTAKCVLELNTSHVTEKPVDLNSTYNSAISDKVRERTSSDSSGASLMTPYMQKTRCDPGEKSHTASSMDAAYNVSGSGQLTHLSLTSYSHSPVSYGGYVSSYELVDSGYHPTPQVTHSASPFHNTAETNATPSSVFTRDSQSETNSSHVFISRNNPTSQKQNISITPREGNNTSSNRYNMATNEALTSPNSSVGTKKAWHCGHCDIVFMDSAIYFMHVGLHKPSNPWTCNLCDNSYHDVYSFTSHFINMHK